MTRSPRARALATGTIVCWRIVHDLTEQGAECSGGRSCETNASFAGRPDCDVDGRVEEVGDIVEAINEREADDSS